MNDDVTELYNWIRSTSELLYGTAADNSDWEDAAQYAIVFILERPNIPKSKWKSRAINAVRTYRANNSFQRRYGTRQVRLQRQEVVRWNSIPDREYEYSDIFWDSMPITYQQKRILRLFVENEYTAYEISKLMNMPISTLYYQRNKALDILRKRNGHINE